MLRGAECPLDEGRCQSQAFFTRIDLTPRAFFALRIDLIARKRSIFSLISP
jgi:hypothetical protein